MTPQIGCDRRNPAGRLTLSSALRYSSSTIFVASFSFLDQSSNSNGGDHAGFRMPYNHSFAQGMSIVELRLQSVFYRAYSVDSMYR